MRGLVPPPANSVWDVVVVGAGPAGSSVARALARRGSSVLLVDRQALPRAKVCGCCLNPASLRALREGGVDLRALGVGQPLRRLEVLAWDNRAVLPWNGWVVSREELDLLLAERAVEAGAQAWWPARAQWAASEPLLAQAHGRAQAHDQLRWLRLVADEGERVIGARVVVAADGLGGSLLAPAAGSAARRSAPAHLGLGARVRDFEAGPEAGTVRMVVGTEGYLGLVRLADGQLNVAASLRSTELASGRTPGAVVNRLLAAAELPGLPETTVFRGTPALRVARRPWATRVLAAGDAAAFWEPFTGEGIGWAVEGAGSVAAAARELAPRWSDRRAASWARGHARWLRRRQRASRWVAWAAASRRRSRIALWAIASSPGLARHLPGSAGSGVPATAGRPS